MDSLGNQVFDTAPAYQNKGESGHNDPYELKHWVYGQWVVSFFLTHKLSLWTKRVVLSSRLLTCPVS